MAKSDTDLPELPFMVHFLQTLTVQVGRDKFGSARVCSYGEELEITAEVVEANTDRNGRCRLLELVAEGEKVRLGPWPADVLPFESGSPQWLDARESARQEAHAIEDPARRARALREVRERFGDLHTSRTLTKFGADVA